ncbi:CPBP family intramembrane glutamic endopeptidase [Nocardia noduli]|uniref:CPBP family intramembrane glutamic endopeptidase n=1 Tax=Nocardia noduli TaxID=2815722 RepID=UPI0020B3885F|nr:type II CAAX endopeptidase family protein [Nocardia noduli]
MNRSAKRPWRRMTDGRDRYRLATAGVWGVGTGLLGASLASRPDSAEFYGFTLATAATFTLGGLAATPPAAGPSKRQVLTPVVIGVGAFGVFYGCALVVRRIPFLRNAIAGVLQYAERGSTPPVLLIALANGAAEEIFFRGAVYAAVPERPIAVSTLVYMGTTAATRNPALVLAAAVMGALFGAQRRWTGGVRAPMITHLTWSTLMIHFLPPLFAPAASAGTDTER